MRVHIAVLGFIALQTALSALGEHAAVSFREGPAWAEEVGHDGEEGHAEEGGKDPEEGIRLSAAERAEFGIEVAEAAAGRLAVQVHTPGEVQVNPDLVAHIVPRIGGVARDIHANIGDPVRRGQILAVLDSPELSELKSAYLVSRERLELARATFEREKSLWDQSISSERQFQKARNGLAEALIELQAAEQKLQSLGFSGDYLAGLSFEDGERFTRYPMTAPLSGTVISKHIVRGEVLQEDSEAFVVADLRSVWVMLTAYQKDLPFLRVGQTVHIEAGQGGPSTTASVDYISPIVDEATRTAPVRIELSNPEGRWRPGSFVTATISGDAVQVPVLVPGSAVQTLDDHAVVFVETGEGFVPQPVRVGRSNSTHSEIVAGLETGQSYVARGAFILKSQLAKGAFGDGHSH